MNDARSNRGGLRAASLFLLFVLAASAVGGFRHPVSAQTQAPSVRMSVGASGFEPSRVSVGLGLVHFVVTSREGDHCFAIPALDIEKRVRAGRALEVDVTFERSGEFPFLCCVEGSGTAEVGTIVVK